MGRQEDGAYTNDAGRQARHHWRYKLSSGKTFLLSSCRRQHHQAAGAATTTAVASAPPPTCHRQSSAVTAIVLSRSHHRRRRAAAKLLCPSSPSHHCLSHRRRIAVAPSIAVAIALPSRHPPRLADGGHSELSKHPAPSRQSMMGHLRIA